MRTSLVPAFIALGLVALAAPTPALGEVPPRTASGLTLEVPEELLGDGQAYYVLDGDTQIRISNSAELQFTTLSTGSAVGFLVGPFVEDSEDGSVEQPALAGALRIPSGTLRSGSRGTDRLLHGAGFLDVANHPEIGVELLSVSDVEAVAIDPKELGSLIRVRANLSVAVDFKGNRTTLDVPAELSYRLSSRAAMSRMVGDLATLAAEFAIPLETLGVKVPPPLAVVVGPEISVSLFLAFSNVTPDRTLDSTFTQQQHMTESRMRVLLADLRSTEEGWALAQKYSREHWEDAVTLNRLAFTLLTLEGQERTDFAFISKVAERANELREGRDGHVLNTLARVQFELGQLEEAVRLQKSAVANLEGVPARIAQAIRGNLERFEAVLAARK